MSNNKLVKESKLLKLRDTSNDEWNPNFESNNHNDWYYDLDMRSLYEVNKYEEKHGELTFDQMKAYMRYCWNYETPTIEVFMENNW